MFLGVCIYMGADLMNTILYDAEFVRRGLPIAKTVISYGYATP